MTWGDRSGIEMAEPSIPRRGTGTRVLAGALAALASLAWLASGGADAGTLAGPLLVVGIAGRHNLLTLLGWIAGGAGIVGVLLWGIATFASLSVAPELMLAAGIAIGGGLGGVVRLLSVEEEPQDTAETVTFERSAGGSDDSGPEPRPADLFEGSPDPIVYYDDSGDGPVVRAVNPAFEDAFGVASGAVEDAALGDALMLAEGVDDLVAAAAAGTAFSATLACETAAGEQRCVVRLASVSDEAGTRGYVLYTPLEN